jgi:hypothetical protein
MIGRNAFGWETIAMHLSLLIGIGTLLPILNADQLVPGAPPGVLPAKPGVRQLFLDDVGIAEIRHLTRVLHPPKRYPKNPVLVPDTAWEDRCQVYGTAMYDADAARFKIWYLTTPRNRGLRPLELGTHQRAPHTTLAAYAESRDGITWRKPELGIFPYDGDRRNNLLGIGHYNCEGISVLYEPNDPQPSRRYKAVYWDHGSGGWELRNGGPYCKPGPKDGLYVALSADGIHWKPYEGNPVISAYCDTNQNVVHDMRLGKYVAFSRLGFGRKLARTESADFIHWTRPQLVLECDAADGPGTQIYGAGVDIYEGVYLAMIWIYREGGDGKIDTQLATSRDGVHWTRVADRATWLALGPDDSWEGGMARSVERIIPRGDELYIYYCGVHGAHTGPNRAKVVRKHRTSIGLVTQRRDGFVSLRAGNREGSVVTAPQVLPAGELHVNADAAKGTLTASILSLDGKPIAGLESSRAVTGDALDRTVQWDTLIPADLRGKPVRLRFTLRSADLFSYWWR